MRRFKKILTLTFICVFLFLDGWMGQAGAASGNADGTYTVTVTQVEVSSDSGTTYTTLFNGSTVVNIASVDAGGVAAGLISGATMVPGVYDRVRVTIGANLLLKGYVNNGATTIYTDGTTFSTNLAAADAPGNDYAISTFSIPVASRIQTFNTSISIGPTVTKIKISFDTSGVITQSGGTPSVGAPSVDISTSG